ncbi:MAG: response regulator [Fibrobacteria bacterium]|nr:response regulator [Fibrobacteria bacterium]
MGVSLQKNNICYISDIPKNTQFQFKTFLGDIIPQEMVIIPVLQKGNVNGAIILASLQTFKDQDRELINQIWLGLNTMYNSLVANNAVRDLANELEIKNEELVFQASELQTKSDELGKQTEELKIQQRSVEEANRLKSEFLSNMSHELRTPLNSILSIPQALLASKTTSMSEKEKKYLGIIERNGKTLLSLINNILDLSKIEAGRVEVSVSTFNLHDFINESLFDFRLLAEKKNLGIHYEVREENLPVISDRFKLKQVLTNLVGNAIKFTEKGHITIKAGRSNESLFIEVSDTGIGIEAQDLNTIFDEFRQLDGSTSRKYEGTGLGLSISNRLMALLNGTITVQSEKGKGSIFTMSFPTEIQNQKGEHIGHAELPHWDSSTVINPILPDKPETLNFSPDKHHLPQLLIVEDNPDATEQILHILKELEVFSITAENGIEALDKIQNFIPDGIILDLMMPEMDGLELLERLRSRPETRHTPVLVLTAKELTSADFEKLRNNHISQLIIKGSVDRSELKFKIEEAFNLVKSTRQMPAKQPDTQTNEIEKTARRTPSPGNIPVVLIIEDSSDNTETMKLLLDGYNCKLIQAMDGPKGLQAVLDNNPDLILLDIQLPEMSGYDVLKKIRSNPARSDIPVVAVTAHAMKGDEEKIRTAGFDAYIPKPIDKNILYNVLNNFIKK